MRRAVWIFLIAPLAGGACLTSTQATRLQTDLEEVKKQLFEIQQTAAGNRTKLEEFDSRLSGGNPAASTDRLAESIQSLIDQNRALADQLDEIKSRLTELSKEVRSARSGGAASQPPTRSGAPSAPAASSGDPAFNAAYGDYSKGNYELALMGFNDYLRARPDSPMAPEAQYWIGECLYSQGKFKEAVEAFGRCATAYPGSPRAAVALLKKGISQVQAGQTTQGITTLQKLIETQPESEEARLAAERLQQMGLRTR